MRQLRILDGSVAGGGGLMVLSQLVRSARFIGFGDALNDEDIDLWQTVATRHYSTERSFIGAWRMH